MNRTVRHHRRRRRQRKQRGGCVASVALGAADLGITIADKVKEANREATITRLKNRYAKYLRSRYLN